MSLTLDPTSVTAWATVVLAGVTIYYAFITNSILNETRKGREIKYIEEKLEKFYLPLQNALIIYADDEDYENDDYGHVIEKATNLNKKLSEVENYNYFASPELKKLIPPFQHAFYYFKNYNPLYHDIGDMYGKMDDSLGKIEENLDKDIKECLEKILKLTY